jgi:hypothetical protein
VMFRAWTPPAAEPPAEPSAAEPADGAGAGGDLQDHEATQSAATTPTEKDLENNAERTTMAGSVRGSPRVRASVVPRFAGFLRATGDLAHA